MYKHNDWTKTETNIPEIKKIITKELNECENNETNFLELNFQTTDYKVCLNKREDYDIDPDGFVHGNIYTLWEFTYDDYTDKDKIIEALDDLTDLKFVHTELGAYWQPNYK